MKKPEILAPAGSFGALTAAVRCGADAVYFGGKSLNARRGADNFDDDELFRAAEYCRTRGVKFYITLNTLISENETEQAVKAVKRACAIGADALILQDIGLSGLVRESSDISMHASTQMSVQTLPGLELLREMGFCRAVLPRELSRGELFAITKSAPLETEVFVHGALCMSVSGQCYMSAMLGSRSGNRGLCAQPCRLPFAAANGTGHDLSLKDLSLIEHLSELAKAGVDSFKIEGRMKRPEYVAAAVTACRMALDGGMSGDMRYALESVFSRSGFTDGYYLKEGGRRMFGTRRREDAAAAAAVLPRLAKLYEKEPQSIPAVLTFECVGDRPAKLTAAARGHSFTAFSEAAAEPSVLRELTKKDVAAQLSKCGGTCFFANSLEIKLENGLYMPLSELNSLRRKALEGLQKELAAPNPCRFEPHRAEISPHESGECVFYARFPDTDSIPDNLDGIGKVILPIGSCTEDFKKYGAIPELPRGIFGEDGTVLQKLTQLKESGVKSAVCGTLDGAALAKKAGLDFSFWFGSNIYNSLAVLEAQRIGASEALLSVELTAAEAARIGGTMRRGVFAYGRVPLMLTRNCPAANGKECAVCKGSGSITDRKRIAFPVRCQNGCAEVLNSCPVYMADKLDDIKNTDFLLLYFTTEKKSDVEEVLDSYRRRLPPKGNFTRGLFYRGTM